MFGLKLDYPQFALRLAERFLAEPGRRLLLVPHTFAPPDRTESDPGACQEVLDKLPPELRARAHLVTGEYDQHEIKGIIGKCNFFVGSRMHACIAALSQGIPTVGVAYSKKFRGVFDTVGAAEWVVDGRECDVEQAISATMKIYNQREALRQPLACRVREAQELLFTTFRQLMNGSSDQMRVPAQQ
jgi:polysaccharide pyruvyl transferase WcaK-like protein